MTANTSERDTEHPAHVIREMTLMGEPGLQGDLRDIGVRIEQFIYYRRS